MLFRVLATAILAAGLTGTALAETLLAGSRRPPSSDRAVRPALPDDVAKTLEADFAALAAAASAREAHAPEQRILAAFNRSGSATVDLFMEWANEAFSERDYPRTLDLLDQVLVLRPGYAEAYNRRATVYYAMDDYRRSLADIRTTLALEPRHFGALTGLAAILSEIGDHDRARDIYRRVLEIHPHLEAAREGLDKLGKEDAGSPI